MTLRKKLGRARKLARLGRSSDALRWLLFSLAGSKRCVRVRVKGHDILVRANTPDITVALTCFEGEFDEVKRAFPALRYPLIIDAGGYIGTAAIVLATAYPNATVLTLEPSRENFAILKQNVAPYKNIVPINKALAAEPGSITLKDRGTGCWGFTLVDRPDDNPNSVAMEKVECTTLVQLMGEFNSPGIGILKLDIEGAEYALLSGDLDWVPRTEAICFELHDRIVAGCTEKYEAATQGRHNTKLEGEKYLSLVA